MKAHVICCNDMVQAVVLGDEAKANEHMKKLVKKDWLKYKDVSHYTNYEQYWGYNHWHITTVNAVLIK
jgi:hypothetical protein